MEVTKISSASLQLKQDSYRLAGKTTVSKPLCNSQCSVVLQQSYFIVSGVKHNTVPDLLGVKSTASSIQRVH